MRFARSFVLPKVPVGARLTWSREPSTHRYRVGSIHNISLAWTLQRQPTMSQRDRSKKLSLHRETVRHLDTNRLRTAAGGTAIPGEQASTVPRSCGAKGECQPTMDGSCTTCEHCG